MNSRDLILGRIRSALADGAAAPAVPRDYRRGDDRPDLDLLVERLADYRAVVHRAADVGATIEKILGTGMGGVPPALPMHWLPPGVEALVDEGLPADRIAAADGVVTA